MTESHAPMGDPRQAWREQASTGFRMSSQDLAARVGADERRFRRSGMILSSIVVLEIVAMAVIFVFFKDPLQRAGAALVAAGMLVIALQIAIHARRVAAARTAVQSTSQPSVAFVVRYLRVRRQFHSGVWLWTRLLALTPGLPVVVYAIARRDSDASVLAWAIAAAFVLLLAGGYRRQRTTARAYTRQIDALERAGSSTA